MKLIQNLNFRDALIAISPTQNLLIFIKLHQHAIYLPMYEVSTFKNDFQALERQLTNVASIFN